MRQTTNRRTIIMNPSFRLIQSFIPALVAAAGVLVALAPAVSQAQNNTYYGTGALQSGTKTGVDDSAFGVDALHDITTGTSNTATGFSALLDDTTGGHNTADGQGALALNTTGTANTAIGMQSLFSCKTDSEETATGYQALFSDAIGFGGMPNQNVALGYQALYSSTDGFENLAAGYQALYHSIQGDDNTALGYQALFGLTTGVNNIAIGHGAGNLVTSGSGNIDIGSPGVAADNAIIRIGDGTQTDTYLTGVIHGNGSGLTSITIAPSAITGFIPGSKLVAGSVTAAQIHGGAVGSLQLAPNLTLNGNTSIANEMSLPETDSSGTTGVLNIGGYPFLNAIGVLNTFVGGAGNFTMTGPENTAIGAAAFEYNSTGGNNTAIGFSALQANSDGSDNTAIGAAALTGLGGGDYNIGIGSSAGVDLTSGGNNIYIGDYNSTTGYSDENPVESNTIRLGEVATQTATYIAGIYGAVTTDPAAMLVCIDTKGHVVTSGKINLPATNSSGSNGVLSIGGVPFLSAIGGNAFLGGAGNLTMTGVYNTGAGRLTLSSNTTGDFNAASGYHALEDNTTGGSNTVTGAYSLLSNTSGRLNTATGARTLYRNTTGINNIAVGAYSGLNLTTGSNNIEIGDYNVGMNQTDDVAGETNTIRIGELSAQTATYIAGIYGTASTDPSATPLYIDKTGHVVTSPVAGSTFNELSLPATSSSAAGVLAIGGSPFLNAYGPGNTFVGGAGNFTMTGLDNTGAGRLTLSSNTTGSYNAVNGFSALEKNTTGNNNTVAGAFCLFSNTSGRLNTAIGVRSLNRNTSGSNNTAVGAYSGVNLTTGSNNIEIGDYNFAINRTDDVAGETDTIRIGEVSAQTATYIAGIYGAASTDPTATVVYIDKTGHIVTSASAVPTFNEISLPATRSAGTSGVLNIGGYPFLNAIGVLNTFVGDSGNFAITGVQNTAIGADAFEKNTTGGSNTVAGAFCLFSNTSGRLNTAIGVRSLYRNTTGVNDTAVGAYSGINLTTGSNNIDLGDYNFTNNYGDDVAGETNTIRIGEVSAQTATYIAGIYGAVSTDPAATLVYIDTKGRLVTSSTAALKLPAGSVTGVDIASGAVGSTQLGSNITLSGNTTIGSEISLPATDSSGTNGVLRIGGHPFLSALNGNAFVGGAGNFTMTGVDNVATGGGALEFDTTGAGNTVIGLLALVRNTTGGYNTASGLQALYSNTTGFYNVAGGFDALVSNTTGSDNTASGYNSLGSNTAGNNNTASGFSALQNSTTGSNNTAAGYTAGGNIITGSNDIDLGDYEPNTGLSDDGAGESNTIRIGGTATQTATYIAGIYGAASTDPAAMLMYIDQTGHVVTSSTAPVMLATGEISLPATSSSTSGVLNLGGIAFLSAPGTDNTFVGGAGNVVLTGSYNTASGFQALHSNTSGENNTASGFQALYANGPGYGNTACGQASLALNKTGYYNTAMGSSALYSNTGGANNLGAGFFAGSNLTTGSNNIDLGDATVTAFVDDVAGESNTIRIGELSTQTATYIAGIYNQSYNANDTPAAVFIDSTGKLGTMSVTPSSRQFKKEIKPMGDASDAILSLKPVTFQYIKPEYDTRGGTEFGLIAEEVDKICPDLVAHNKDGGIYGIRYDAVNAMLLNEFLKEHQRVEAQGRTIAQQQKAIEALTATLNEQGSLLQKVSAQVQLMKPAPQIVSNNKNPTN
jgi:hypothetical protein